jgi:hypothetical protein
VTNESAKCRSGRDADRVGLRRPSGRGGKSTDAFGYHERVTTHDNRNVVVPPGERASLEVVETELALEVFIHALNAPPFL